MTTTPPQPMRGAVTDPDDTPDDAAQKIVDAYAHLLEKETREALKSDIATAIRNWGDLVQANCFYD